MKFKRIHKSKNIPLDSSPLTELMRVFGDKWVDAPEENLASYYTVTDLKHHIQKYVVSIKTNQGVIEFDGKIPLDLMMEDNVDQSDFYDLHCIKKKKRKKVYDSLCHPYVRKILILAYHDMEERMGKVTCSPEARKILEDKFGSCDFIK